MPAETEGPDPGPAATRFNAVVLAGDRGRNDPVATAAGVAAKCLTPIGGTPMVLRVVRALEQSACVNDILLCGPAREALDSSPALRAVVGSGVRWLAPQGSPSASAAAALASLEDGVPVLVTTGDHALLSPEMVRHFLAAAGRSGADIAVGLAPHELVRTSYPGTRRTVLKFSDGRYCGCNLFAFLTPRGRGMARLWQQVENERKRPIRVIGFVGWLSMARYALGVLSLDAALRRISRKTGITAAIVEMPFAEAAIDVDTVADLELVRAIVARAP